MDILLSPPILFFFLGVVATLVKSDLEVPKPIARLLSLYLLTSIGMYGGYKLSLGALDGQTLAVLFTAIAASFTMPLVTYAVLRLKLGVEDAAAIAACYGSISAVTFITAVAFLEHAEIQYSGFMVASMALMESPAIISGVLLSRLALAQRDRSSDTGDRSDSRINWRELGAEALFNAAVILLVGAMIIGFVTGEKGWAAVAPLMYDPFKGVLCLFLLDMGLIAARRLGDLRKAGFLLMLFGVVAAVAQGAVGIGAAYLLGLTHGDALLLAILFGSASYIAVPAAMRLAVPNANPSLYIPLSLAITFPFNIIVGIPVYHALLSMLGFEM